MSMNRLVRFTLFILPGVVLIILAVILGWVVLPNVIDGKITEQVRLVKGSETWDKWKDPPIPIHINFYVHHITNPGEVEDGKKPVFQEKGPYIYREKRIKVELDQSSGPNTIKYKEVVTYHFDQRASGNNTENDLVNVPNIPFVGVINTIRKQLPLDLVVSAVGNLILFQENLIKQDVPVKELLFEGFDVTKYTNSLLGSRLPEAFSGGRFGLYKGRNGTPSKPWEVYTGMDTSANFGRVKSWDGRAELGFWKRYSKCDHIRGTDGSVFRPFLSKSSVLDIFGAELCSSLSIYFEKEIEYRGIAGYRFRMKYLSDEDEESAKERECFCVEEDPKECPLAGVLSLESCMKAPIYSSLPYFLDADESYTIKSGLAKANKEKHETFVDVEPMTGLLLRAHKRNQINLKITSNRKVRALQSLSQDSVLFPVVWADENVELTDQLVADLQSTLLTPLKIIEIARWTVLGLGILLVFLGIIIFLIIYVCRSPEGTPDPEKRRRLSSLVGVGGAGTVGSSQGKFPPEEKRKKPVKIKIPSSSSSSSSSSSTTNTDPDEPTAGPPRLKRY